MSSGRTSWLSMGPEMLVRHAEAQAAAGAAFDCDVLIVGSGYGGAVAAARLAGLQVPMEAGGFRPASVWLIERGKEYLPGTFPDRFAELAGHVRFSQQDGGAARGRAEGLFDVRMGADANVLLGSGLGGGSLINAGVMARPLPDILESGWPAALRPAALEAGYAAALAMLQPQVLPAASELPKLVALQRLAGAAESPPEVRRCPIAVNFASVHVTPAGVAMQPCTLCGDCVSGCNQNAKLTLDTNYLAVARQHGAQLFTGATVERVVSVETDRASHWRVDWHFTEPSRRPPDGRAFSVRAAKLVLAAGSLGSTEILLRSSSAALQFSAQLGARFSSNGDTLIAGFRQNAAVHACGTEQADPADPLARGVGPTITGLAQVAAGTGPDESAFAVQEFAVPAALRRVFGEVVTTASLLNGHLPEVPSPGAAVDDPLAATDAAIEHTALYGLMGDDGAGGRLVFAARKAGGEGQTSHFGDGQIRVVWPALSRHPLFDRQLQWLEKASSARGGPGGTALCNPLWRPLGPLLASVAAGPATTVHPLGGCPMGDSAATGVVDAIGQVFRADGGVHKGLVVLDGSIVPRALAINPALTIAALSEQACVTLQHIWGWRAGSDPKPLPQLVPRYSRLAAQRTGKRIPSTAKGRAQGTAIELAEHFHGPLDVNGHHYWAALRLRTQTIDDLAAFVQRLPRRVTLAAATLELTPVDLTHDAFSLLPDTGPVVRFTLAGHISLFEPTATNAVLSRQNQQPAQSRELRYDMTVVNAAQISDGGATVIAAMPVGTTIIGLKLLKAGDPISPWTRLTQLDVRLGGSFAGGEVPAPTVWQLDLAHMARLRRLMLRVTRQANAPEGIADLAALGLFVARILLVTGRLLDPSVSDMPSHLNERYPQALDGRLPRVLPVGVGSGARLSHYASPPAQRELAKRPVLMIHGLGASGSTFAHPSIANNLVRFALARHRDVWVLDLSTSIGNETAANGGRQGRHLDFEAVAMADIPAALRIVHAASDGTPVDVIAHCIGSAMFCVALLESARSPDRAATAAQASALRPMVGAVVLSQVGPLLRLSPLNQLRGFVASYLQQFLGTMEFDTRPDYRREPEAAGGEGVWKQQSAGLAQTLVDWAIARFPYPPDDDEITREKDSGVPFRRVRHRADAIFGQLMELRNVGTQTLAALDAIYGWVKVSTLAQTIHFARHRMLTNASGENASLVRQFFDQGFDFPTLLLHGKRNRVFDWRGALDSFELLAALRPVQPGAELAAGEGGVWRSGRGLELRVIEGYGHQDCLIGENAHRDVFPAMFHFLDAQAARPSSIAATAAPVRVTCELPWIGPMLGWLRRDDGEKAFLLSVLVHAHPRHARTLGVAVVPMLAEDGAWKPVMSLARGFLAQDLASMDAPSNASLSASAAFLSPPSSLLLQHCVVLRLARHGIRFQRLAILTLHSDLPVATEALLRERSADVDLAGEWLLDSRPLGELALPALTAFFEVDDPDDQRVQGALLALTPEVFQAADVALAKDPAATPGGGAATRSRRLCFALGSCQYPPGLLDADCAEASYRQLLALLPDSGGSGRAAGDAPDREPPQFLVLCGDQVYVDATAGVFDPAPVGSRKVVAKAYELSWRMPAFRAVAARLPVYTLLDDHEVGDNWQPTAGQAASTKSQAEALEAYAVYQARIQPTPRQPDARRYAFSPGGIPFFALDTRSERTLRRVTAKGDGQTVELATLVSAQSMADLQGWLLAQPEAVPKFVICPTPVLPVERFAPDRSAERLRSDGWSGYPASLWSVLDFIRDHNVRHVVFLSGDLHFSLATKLVFSGGQNAVHSVVSSGLFAPWPFANALPDDFVLEGEIFQKEDSTVVLGQMVTAPLPAPGGFAVVTVSHDVTPGPLELHVGFVGRDGLRQAHRIDMNDPRAAWQSG